MVLLGEVEDEKAERLVKVCPQNVFDIEDMGNGKVKAFHTFLQNLLMVLISY